MSKKESKRKVLVIGLDGATFDLIKPWINQGKLPTINKLMENGVWGDLESTIPPWTPPAWTSFMTGKNPGKHGIFDFVKREDNSYEHRLVNSADIGTKCIWDILGGHGKKSIVINLPVTYPPRKIDGIMIPGLMTPPTAQKYTYPDSIIKELEENIGDYVIFPSEEAIKALHKGKFDEIFDVIKCRTDAALYLMDHYEYDLFIVQFQMTDLVLHTLDDNEKILELYQKIDESIRKLIQNNDQMNIILLSDHGFGYYKKKVHINKWLSNLGLFKTERSKSRGYISTTDLFEFQTKQNDSNGLISKIRNLLPKFGITIENINRLLVEMKLEAIKKLIPNSFISLLPRTNTTIKWGETKAYLSTGISFGITINLKGREPQGVVNPGEEYEELRSFIIQELSKLKDPITGEKIINKVFKKEEIYSGAYLNNAPDIMFLTANMEYMPWPYGKTLLSDYNVGSHKMNGILIACGPNIKQGELINGAKIIDIAPTALHILSVPIPEDIDGRVLQEIFKGNSEPAKRDITYQKVDERRRIGEKIRELKVLGRI